jgi:hypothetical protein
MPSDKYVDDIDAYEPSSNQDPPAGVNTNWDPDPYDDEKTLGGITPVSVKIVSTEIEERVADFSSWVPFTVPLLTAALPVQLLQRRPLRHKAYIQNNDGTNSVLLAETPQKIQANQGFLLGPGKVQIHESQEPVYAGMTAPGAGSQQTAVAQGQVTSPGAGANISGFIGPASLPAGTYQVVVAVYIDGTPAPATDDDNMKLNISGGLQTHLSVPSNGQVVTYTFYTTLNGAQTIDVITNNAGTAGSVYHASLLVTPYPISAAGEGTTISIAVKDEAWLAK